MDVDEKPEDNSDVVADFTDPEQLYENRDQYPEMMEEIEDEFGEVTVETCEKALEQVAEEFARLAQQDASDDWRDYNSVGSDE